MDLRIFTEPQQGATYDTLLTVAKATEDLGFDAFFRSGTVSTHGANRPGGQGPRRHGQGSHVRTT
ncbi:hypothetical protein AB0928_42405, partial [Streptomyces sp. NPDC026666]